MSSGLFNGGVTKDLIDTILANQPATSGMAGPIATGQAYAQQIAGGMPASQVIAPGVVIHQNCQADIHRQISMQYKYLEM